MRDLMQVLEHMKNISTNKEFCHALARIQNDLGFTAPELMAMRWDLAHECILDYYPNPLENAESLRIISLFSTLSEEEIRSRCTPGTI